MKKLSLFASLLILSACNFASAPTAPVEEETPPADTATIEPTVTPVEEPVIQTLPTTEVDPAPTPEPAPTPVEEPAPQPSTQSVSIANFVFYPFRLTINTGDTVVWTNNDSAPHTVTGSGLDSGTLENGGTFSHTFSETGTFSYYCAIHPSMTAEIIVK